MYTNGTKYSDGELADLKSQLDLAGLEAGRLGIEGCYGKDAVLTPGQQDRHNWASDILDRWFKRFTS